MHASPISERRAGNDERPDELGLCARDAFDGLSRHWLAQEAYEIAGVPCLHRYADFAVRLEAADPRTVSGARVDDDKWPPLHIDFDALRRNDAHQRVVDRLVEL